MCSETKYVDFYASAKIKEEFKEERYINTIEDCIKKVRNRNTVQFLRSPFYD